MKNKLILTLLFLIFSFSVQAQKLTTENGNLPNEVLPSETIVTEPAELPSAPIAQPTEMTAEQKIAHQRSLRRNIQNIAVNSSPKERKLMLKTIETLEKMRIRQENIGKPKIEHIEFEKPNVNVNDRKDFQKYMQKIFIDDVDDRINKLMQPQNDGTAYEETNVQNENTTNE